MHVNRKSLLQMILENKALKILDFDYLRKLHPAEAYTCSSY